MQALTEFRGRTAVLAWSTLAFLYVWTGLWFAIQRPFVIDSSVVPRLSQLYGCLLAMLLALGWAKTRVTASEKWIDRALHRVLGGFQLLVACYVFLLSYALCSTVLTYVGQAVGAPLQDGTFAAADAALGLDFLGFHSWVGTQPVLVEAMYYAYHSCPKQFTIIFVVCAIFMDRENAAQFCALLAMTLIPTVIIASLWPALGSCIYHAPVVQPFAHLDPLACREYLPHVESLRAGTFEVFDFREAKGILTFPSFHTVMAIIATYAVRNYIWLLVPFALVNAVNIVATVPYGGHYFVDVAAGAVIAFAAIAVVRWNAARQTSEVLEPLRPAAAAV